jgi:hypothetical protein
MPVVAHIAFGAVRAIPAGLTTLCIDTGLAVGAFAIAQTFSFRSEIRGT